MCKGCIFDISINHKNKHNEKRNRTIISRIFSSLLPYWTTSRRIRKMIYAICFLLIATGFVMAALTDYTLKQYNDQTKQRIHRQVLRK